MNVTLCPTVLQWARRRAGLSEADLGRKLSADLEQVQQWETDGVITYKRAEKLAEKTHTPFGYLFLPEPPEEKLPVADFRTLGSDEAGRPSPELLDVLFDAMRKQNWYRDFLIEAGESRLEFVGSARIEQPAAEVAEKIGREFSLDTSWRSGASNWEAALTLMFERLEDQGVLVLRSGVADGNTHRPLRVEEFRGFALSDPYAPVIFINTRDSQAAQLFTAAHELVHIWLGLSGVSNPEQRAEPSKRVELFCNEVAAELLVPMSEIRDKLAELTATDNPVPALCRYFKVSSLVILRRLHDLKEINWETYRGLYREEETKFHARKATQKSGGNYYATQQVRAGRRFARALIGSALEGRTPYREAFSLLGVRKTATFNELARKLHFQIP
ncbi:MAG: ImmA/IrrE family metallo-endopeptidase [Verrucomicrobiota bacterium]